MNLGRTYSSMAAADQAIVDSVVNRGLRQFYFPPPLQGEARSHTWTFLRPVETLTTSEPYETGTITIAAGVVTLTGGTFPSWAAQGEITVDGSTYDVSTRDGNTQVTLVDTSVTIASASTYTLARVVYDAPDNFGGIEGSMTYASNTSGSHPIPMVGEGMIRQMRARSDGASTSKPCYFAVRPKSDMLLTGQRFEFLLYPNADDVYVLTYRYLVLSNALSTGQYPLGGMEHAETILASAMYVASQHLHNEQPGRIQSAKDNFMDRLAASVHHDRALMGREKFGYNGDNSDNWGWGGREYDPDAHLTTYEGTLY